MNINPPLFLEQVASYILTYYGQKSNELMVVLPSRRGKLFLKKHLSKLITKPFITPIIYSIEDFVYEISGLQKIENYELLFEFYKIYSTIEKEIQPFEEFVSWATILLNDFNELDAYNTSTKFFFEYLNEDRVLKEWSPDGLALTEFQKKYLQFWKTLPVYYQALKSYCLENNKAYQGLAYRIAAEKIDTNPDYFKDKKILFVGFNALSGCEEQLINQLTKKGNAEILFDADEYFLTNNIKEAGKSLQKHRKNKNFTNFNLGKFLWINSNFKNTEKNITIIPCSYDFAQSKIAADILNTHYNPISSDKWCVVLADETLLIPTINALPEQIKEANISMGYPFKNSPLFAFILSYLQTINSSRNFKGERKVLTKKLLNLLSKPQATAFIKKDISQKLSEQFLLENILFVGKGELLEFAQEQDINSLLNLIFNTEASVIKKVTNLCKTILEFSGNDSIQYSLTQEAILFFEKLNASATRANITLNSKQFMFMLKQLAGQLSLPFIGEPLQGLQINGLLETRTLDFENLIILSLNEGYLPSGKKSTSFIPLEIKRNFGLPTFNDKDAIFSYHFYRLLSRAKNIYLLYVENDESEKSRFIDQLLFELPTYNSKIKIETQKYNSELPINKELKEDEQIIKNDSIINIILEKFKKGISPSALNNYRDCSLKFYYSEVAKIKEDDELDDELDAALFGTILHHCLEHIFKPAAGINLTEKVVTNLFTNKKQLLNDSFDKNFGRKNTVTGKNAILYNVMLKLLDNYKKVLLQEVKSNTICIENLEKELSYQITLNGHSINLYGKADRIEKVNNIIRIIDYKTGLVKSGELSLTSIEEVKNNNRNKSFQVLFYAYLYTSISKINNSILSGIISFRNLSAGIAQLKINNNSLIDNHHLLDFEKELIQLLKEILNPAIPFTKTKDINKCQYCAYKLMCNIKSK